MSKRLKMRLLTISIFFAVMTFQNCGQVYIQRMGSSSVLIHSNESEVTYLKMPALDQQHLRFVVFVDMSNSMVKSPCDEDVDGKPYTPAGLTGSICDVFKSPADPTMMRLLSLKYWLVELSKKLPTSNLAKLKILIVPFTGGYVEEARQANDLSKMIFYDNTVDAIAWVDELIDQQKQTFEFLKIAGKVLASQNPDAEDPMLMGTSVPKTRLARLKELIGSEIENLRSKGDLKDTDFQFVYMSDGKPNPSKVNVAEVMSRIWYAKQVAMGPGQGVRSFEGCVATCAAYVDFVLEPINEAKFEVSGAADKSVMGCSNECINALGAGFNNEGTSGDPNQLLSVIRASWGNDQQNRPFKIIKALDEVRRIMQKNSEAHFHFTFFLVDKNVSPESIESLTLVEKAKNWILYARQIFKKATSHEQMISGETKKDFFPQTIAANSWKLKHFFAININARVDRFGKMALDSDGDGLFDSEEKTTDPKNSRSNGVCLDSIKTNSGCIMPGADNRICNPSLDIDGDSLNDCEERTIGTDPYDFDTDNDGIPDSIEVLFSMNPLKNDTKEDWSSDGVSNYDQFMMGLLPQIVVDDVNADFKVKVLLRFSDYRKDKIGLSDVSVAGYTVRIDNLFAANVTASVDNSRLYFSPEQKPEQQIEIPLVGGSHAKEENRLVLLGYVQSETNPSLGYWIAEEKRVIYGTAKTINLNLNNFLEIFARDPIGSAQ